MYLYRCVFVLTEYNDMTSTLFVRTSDKETAEENTKIMFEKTLSKHGITNAKYTQTVTISSEEEVEEYEHYMRQRDLPKEKLN